MSSSFVWERSVPRPARAHFNGNLSMSNVTSNDSYGTVAKIFHWAIVAMLTAQYLAGWFMPHIARNTRNEGLVSLHLSIGAAILLVIALRFLWRLFFPISPDQTL